MNHQYAGEWAIARRLHQIAAHFAGRTTRGRVFDIARLDPLVGERNRLCFCVTRQQTLRQRQSRYAADGQFGGAAEKLATVDLSVAVLVVKIEDDLVCFLISHRLGSSGIGRGAQSSMPMLQNFTGAPPLTALVKQITLV